MYDFRGEIIHAILSLLLSQKSMDQATCSTARLWSGGSKRAKPLSREALAQSEAIAALIEETFRQLSMRLEKTPSK